MHEGLNGTGPAESCSEAAHALTALADATRVVSLASDVSDAGSLLDELVRVAVARVPGATDAGVTILRHRRFSTLASTGDADEAARASCALSYRLTVLDDPGTTATLNIYSEQVDAFDEASVNTGRLLVTHCSWLVSAMLARDRADNLARALQSNRDIGVAMGILMQRHRLTREQAIHTLRVASQESNRKLADIATEVADTGILAIPRSQGSTSSAADGSHRTVPPRVRGTETQDAGSRAGSLAQREGGSAPWAQSPPENSTTTRSLRRSSSSGP